jgi:hypothetical protein
MLLAGSHENIELKMEAIRRAGNCLQFTTLHGVIIENIEYRSIEENIEVKS